LLEYRQESSFGLTGEGCDSDAFQTVSVEPTPGDMNPGQTIADCAFYSEQPSVYPTGFPSRSLFPSQKPTNTSSPTNSVISQASVPAKQKGIDGGSSINALGVSIGIGAAVLVLVLALFVGQRRRHSPSSRNKNEEITTREAGDKMVYDLSPLEIKETTSSITTTITTTPGGNTNSTPELERQGTEYVETTTPGGNTDSKAELEKQESEYFEVTIPQEALADDNKEVVEEDVVPQQTNSSMLGEIASQLFGFGSTTTTAATIEKEEFATREEEEEVVPPTLLETKSSEYFEAIPPELEQPVLEKQTTDYYDTNDDASSLAEKNKKRSKVCFDSELYMDPASLLTPKPTDSVKSPQSILKTSTEKNKDSAISEWKYTVTSPAVVLDESIDSDDASGSTTSSSVIRTRSLMSSSKFKMKPEAVIKDTTTTSQQQSSDNPILEGQTNEWQFMSPVVQKSRGARDDDSRSTSNSSTAIRTRSIMSKNF